MVGGSIPGFSSLRIELSLSKTLKNLYAQGNVAPLPVSLFFQHIVYKVKSNLLSLLLLLLS